MISTALLALALSVCSFGGAIASVEPRRSAEIPYYDVSQIYPALIDFAPNLYIASQYQSGSVSVSRDSMLDTHFELGYEYILYRASVVYDGDSVSWDSLAFLKVQRASYTSFGESMMPYGCPFSFSFWNQQSSYYVSMFGYDADFSFSKGSIGSAVLQQSTNYYPARFRARYPLTTSTSGPYTVELSEVDLFDELCAWYASYVSMEMPISDAYNQGKQDGRTEGIETGKIIGYNQATEDIGRGGVFTQLFGALVNVPISIFNGVSPLVIWDVPIITIILTFLVIGIVVMIVRKIIL